VKRLLVILETGRRRPSNTVRALAYRDLFASHGFSTRYESIQPLRTIDWLDGLPSVIRRILNWPFLRKRILDIAERARRRRLLSLAREAEIVYLAKVSSYPLILDICRKTKARVVYDIVDAVWLGSKYPDELNDSLRSVDALTTDNEIVAAHLRAFNANCTVVPDAPALHEYDRRRTGLNKKPDGQIVLGWLGSPSTAFNLYVVWEALEELFARHANLHLRLVGTGTNPQLIPTFAKVRVSCRPHYNQAEMIEEVFGMHIGLFPLQDVEICRARGVLKAANYMCGEAVVVTSPVGQCVDVICDGVNGMIANSRKEWIEKLELLIGDAGLRRRLAENGLQTVRSQFRLDQSFAKLKSVLLAGDPPGNAGIRT